MSFNLGNVVKYLWRDGLKNKDEQIPIEDLEKAAFYLNDEIEKRKKELWLKQNPHIAPGVIDGTIMNC